MKPFRIQRIGAIAFLVHALFCWNIPQSVAQDRSIYPNPDQLAVGSSSRGIYLSSAQFLIPFQIAPTGSQPSAVLLYVSMDQGDSWQLYGKTSPDAKHFEFRAAAEGDYLFAVKTVDPSGNAFSSPAPPIKVLVDTTQPQIDFRAELGPTGSLIVTLQAADANLDTKSATVRFRTDRDSEWRQISINSLNPNGNVYQGQVEISLPQCREVVIVASVADLAKNTAEATHHLRMPRTAVGTNDLQLASSRGPASLPGAIPWNIEPDAPTSNGTGNALNGTGNLLSPNASAQPAPTEYRENFSTSPFQPQQHSSRSGPGRLTGRQSEIDLAPSGPPSVDPVSIEELELPEPIREPIVDRPRESVDRPRESFDRPRESFDRQTASADRQIESYGNLPRSAENPYYSKTRTFSLDYSVESLGGTALSSVELWGSEDQGASWQKWGVDPDRVSPFDVKVGNDGLFGFRMVIVGEGGVVLGQPKAGDKADVWICVDTEAPTCRITRAVSGEGTHAGTLVIDYTCVDDHLVEHPISLYFSDRPHGPWTSIASGLKNSGLYLWKVDSGIPGQVYLKLEAVDKAGNVGVHRLDLPIDVQGVTPRGRIQGFRPIYNPS
jgi:hypothetical protein